MENSDKLTGPPEWTLVESCLPWSLRPGVGRGVDTVYGSLWKFWLNGQSVQNSTACKFKVKYHEGDKYIVSQDLSPKQFHLLIISKLEKKKKVKMLVLRGSDEAFFLLGVQWKW